MKIGILTFQFADNYGAQLQAYALRRHLSELGEDAIILPYEPPELGRLYSVNPFSHLPDKKAALSYLFRIFTYPRQKRYFDDFREKRLHIAKNTSLKTHASLRKEALRLDGIILGGDQIWNPELTQNNSAYYGSFCRGIPCVSYAAGTGMDMTLSDIQKSQFQKYLHDLRFVSVREKACISQMEPYSFLKIHPAPDAAFLLSASEWERIMTPVPQAKGKYLLYYCLAGRRNRMLSLTARHMRAETGLPIFMIHPTAKRANVAGKQIYNAGPEEFLSLVKNAEMVCTDSYHGAVFSALFGKKAYLSPLNTHDPRIPELLDSLGLSSSPAGLYDFSTAKENVKNCALRGKIIVQKLLNSIRIAREMKDAPDYERTEQ